MDTRPMIDANKLHTYINRAVGSIASPDGSAMVKSLRRWLRAHRAQDAALRGRPVDHADLKAMLDAGERNPQWRL